MKKAAVLSLMVVVAKIVAGVTAEAQQPKKVTHIGVIFPGSPASVAPVMEALREGLHDLGYVERKNIVIEYRYAEGNEERLPDLATDLVGLKVDTIVVGGGNAALAAKK